MNTPDTIIYLSHSPRVSNVFLPVALAMAEIAPGFRQFCAGFGNDIFPGLPGEGEDHTFDGTSVSHQRLAGAAGAQTQPRDNCWRSFARSLDALLVRENAAAVVVPHDFPGFHHVAVRLAARRRVAAVVIQEALQDFAAFGEPRIREITFEESSALPGSRPRSELRNLLVKQRALLKDAGRLALDWVSAVVRRDGRPGPGPALSPRCAPDNWWWFGQSGATRVGVTGDYYRRRLLARGVPEERISVVGYTRGDLLLSQRRIARPELLRQLGLAAGSRFALAISQDFDNWKWPMRAKHTAALLETARVLEKLAPELCFVILVHPGEDLALSRRAVARARLSRTVAVRAADNHMSLYEACEFVVGFWSTCLVESMLVGRPIITLDYAMVEFFIPNLIEGGAVVPVLRSSDLQDKLERVLKDRMFVKETLANQKRVLADLFHCPDGCAGLRAARCIRDAIGGVCVGEPRREATRVRGGEKRAPRPLSAQAFGFSQLADEGACV